MPAGRRGPQALGDVPPGLGDRRVEAPVEGAVLHGQLVEGAGQLRHRLDHGEPLVLGPLLGRRDAGDGLRDEPRGGVVGTALDDAGDGDRRGLGRRLAVAEPGGGVHRRLGRPVEIGDPDRSTTENVPDVADQPVIVNA